LAYGTAPIQGFPPDDDVYLRHVDMTTRAVTKLAGSEGLWSPRCAADGRILAADWFAQRVYARDHADPDRPGAAFFKLRNPMTALWRSLSVQVPPPGGSFPLFYPTWARDGRSFTGT